MSPTIPSHPQPKITNTSFCVLVGLFLTKLNHYFEVFFRLFGVTLKIGDAASLI